MDEMNIHVPQDPDVRAELLTLSTTTSFLTSNQSSKMNIYIIQDSLLGAYQMTQSSAKRLDRETFFQICMHGDTPPISGVIKREKWSPDYILNKIKKIKEVLKFKGKSNYPYTGRGLISMLLPDDFTYEKKTDADPDEPILKIYRGVLYEGAINKSVIGNSHNSILQTIFKEYSPEHCLNVINNFTFIPNAWLDVVGFSIGIGDCEVTSYTEIQETITRTLLQAKKISETIRDPKICEARINEGLGKAKDLGMKIAKNSMRKKNGFKDTVESGSKGDYFNIAQITGILSQQNISGHRILPALDGGNRTLPHYPLKIEDSEEEFESRGFIRNSFMRGLSPTEFYFHAMSGREGISDTSLKTSNSGYTQRKITKVAEDIKNVYDNTVRNGSNGVIQWAYGEDNLDRSKVVILNGETEICDVSRIINRLNDNYDLESEY